jgi:hypothetical protein
MSSIFATITGLFRPSPPSIPAHLIEKIEGMNTTLTELANEQLTAGIHESNLTSAEFIQKKLTQDLKKIDPALVHESRYKSSLWAPAKKICDFYYAFRNFRFKGKIRALKEYLITINRICQSAASELDSSRQQISSLIQDVVKLQPKPQSEDCNWSTRLIRDVWNWWSPQSTETPVDQVKTSSAEPPVADVESPSPNNHFSEHIQQTLAKGKAVEWNNGAHKSTASGYFYERVFMQNSPIEQAYNPQTGEFRLKFKQEKKIKLDKIPAGKSQEVQDLLKRVIGKTLVIGKEVKGRLVIEENSIEFDSGSLKVPVGLMTAQLSKIAIDPTKDTSNLRLTGSLGVKGTVKIDVQDFVDLFEANLS